MKNILEGAITNYTVNELVNDISKAVLFKKNSSVPDTILQNLDTILKDVEINSSADHQILSTSPNLVVGVIKTGRTNPICGLKVDKINIDMTKASINFLNFGM